MVKGELADKLAVFATKEDLAKEIGALEVRLTRNIFIAGVVQFLAIIGSVLMILKFHIV